MAVELMTPWGNNCQNPASMAGSFACIKICNPKKTFIFAQFKGRFKLQLCC
jgi:hypothetical protein